MTTKREQTGAPPALYRSRAGMRLIALLTIINRGDLARAREYLREQSAASTFADISLAERLAELRLQRRRYGRLRFKQLVGISDLHAIVILAAEDDDSYLLAQLTVEAEYPHSLTQWQLSSLADVNIPQIETTD